MKNKYGFNLPTRIEVEAGLLKNAGLPIKELLVGSKAFIITDPGVIESGITAKVTDSLIANGFTTSVFEQVQANPKDVDCEKGGYEARRFGADLIVAVGGGSVIDSAKAIAMLQTLGGSLSQYEGKGKITGSVTPIIAIPTTAGTGSEVTRSAVITDTRRKFKMTLKDIALAPRLALIDPEATYSLPRKLTASTGMDALVHAVEAYTSLQANPFSDALAIAAIEKIYPALPVTVHNGCDKQARDALMIGSLMAGIAFSHADVGAVHCMAEAIGSIYDTPHGVANSMFLPAVTAFNASHNKKRHARIASACGLDVSNLTTDQAAELLVNKLAELAEEIEIPDFNSLEQADPADFALLAELSTQNGSTPNNCRPISENDYYELFLECYNK